MPIQYGLLRERQLPPFAPLLPEGLRPSGEGVHAVGAVKDGQACGVLVFRADELTADILHLAVSGPFRRQGIANGLIDCLCGSAWASSTAVLCSFSAAGRDDPICRLLNRRGDFTLTEEEGYLCRFPCSELAGVKLSAAPPAGCRIEPFYRLPEDLRHGFFSQLREDNAEHARGLLDARASMLEPLCLCAVEHGAVRAAIFCRPQGGDVLLSFAYAGHSHARCLAALAGRLRELLLRAADRVSYLHIAAVTPESRKLVDTLLPGREITGRFYTACWDMNTIGG